MAGLAQTGRQVANGDECCDLATKTMKWQRFWRQGKGQHFQTDTLILECLLKNKPVF